MFLVLRCPGLASLIHCSAPHNWVLILHLILMYSIHQTCIITLWKISANQSQQNWWWWWWNEAARVWSQTCYPPIPLTTPALPSQPHLTTAMNWNFGIKYTAVNIALKNCTGALKWFTSLKHCAHTLNWCTLLMHWCMALVHGIGALMNSTNALHWYTAALMHWCTATLPLT